jgi:lysophospholipase L1-like esterase
MIEPILILKNKNFAGLFLFLVSILLMFALLGLIEGYLRIFSPQPLIPRYVTNGQNGIRINYPNIDIWHRTPDYKINIRTNNKGIRSDREFAYVKPFGKKRIVVLGDSFTMGYGVNNEDLYVTILSRKLMKEGYDVEVINLGVSGFSNAEELITLENEGIKYEPDLVILAFYQNDLTENVISNLFSVQDGGLVRISEEYLPQVKLRNSLYSFKIYKYLAQNSHLLYLCRRRLSIIIKNLMLRSNQKITKDFDEKYYLKEQKKLAAKIVDKIYETTTNQGGKFILLDIPSQNMRTDIPKMEMRYFHNMNFIDSGDIMKKASVDKLLYWKKSHSHWTPYSHDLIGNKLAQYILDKKLLD